MDCIRIKNIKIKARHGVYVDQMRLTDEDGGEGKYRGGKGIVMDYRVRSKNAWVTVAYTRSKSLPWALDGGNEGGPNYIEVIRKDGKKEKYSVVTGLALEPEDVVRIHTGNGGGCGKPEDRDKQLIEEDLLNEYITPQFKIFHYDLYRINSSQELFEIGVDNYFMQDVLHFIEWASKYTNFLPHHDYQIQFHNYNPYRILKITDYVKQR